MDIQEEIKAAHMAYLQDEWDKWIINGWRKASTITAVAVRAFMDRHNIGYDEFNNLKRIPLYRRQGRTMLTRFVAAYLPQLNSMLWSETLRDDQILAVMKGMDTLNNPADGHKDIKDRAERTKTLKESMAQKASYCLVRDQREYTSKSNWGQCK